jgi:hypothetical protein
VGSEGLEVQGQLYTLQMGILGKVFKLSTSVALLLRWRKITALIAASCCRD